MQQDIFYFFFLNKSFFLQFTEPGGENPSTPTRRLSPFCLPSPQPQGELVGDVFLVHPYGKASPPPAPGLLLLPRGVINTDNGMLCVPKFNSWGSVCLVQPCNRFAAGQSILHLQAELNLG